MDETDPTGPGAAGTFQRGARPGLGHGRGAASQTGPLPSGAQGARCSGPNEVKRAMRGVRGGRRSLKAAVWERALCTGSRSSVRLGTGAVFGAPSASSPCITCLSHFTGRPPGCRSQQPCLARGPEVHFLSSQKCTREASVTTSAGVGFCKYCFCFGLFLKRSVAPATR